MDGEEAPLRIGILGASRVSPTSIIEPARLTDARLVAVTARDRDRAQDVADRHGVERVLGSYGDLVNDPEIEAVWSLPLAGGALMDLGCYSLHAIRAMAPLAGGNPTLINARGAERTGLPGVANGLTLTWSIPPESPQRHDAI
jgi:predicted dehydrogenase